jgi:lambda family phage portal protein
MDRTVQDWVWSYASADQLLEGTLDVLRQRSRELVANVPWARRYTHLLAANVIGPGGIRLQARIGTAVNKKVEEAWRLWGRRGTCTVDGRYSWLRLQRQVVRAIPADGEALLRIVRGAENAFGFALQVLDPDQLDVTYSVKPDRPGAPEIRMGIELTGLHEPVAYHLWSGHPAEPGGRATRERIPADQIIHLFDIERVVQSRGLPWFLSVMRDMHHLRAYFEAELVAARMAAAKGGFFVKRQSEPLPADVGDNSAQSLQMEVEPGLLEKLPEGWEFQSWDPQHPTEAFPEFTKAELRAIATGLGVSYASLTQDLNDTTYGSGRIGLLEERDTYRIHQQWIVEELHERVYAEWVRMAVLAGRLDARASLESYQQIAWQPRGWTWLDPKSEVEATKTELKLGLTTRRRVLAERGMDLEETLDDIAEEDAMIAERGLTLTDEPVAPVPVKDDTDDGAEETEEEAMVVRRNGNGRLAGLLQ